MKPSGSKSVSRNSAILILCLISLMTFVGYGPFTASSSTASVESISAQIGKAQKKSPLSQAPHAQAAGKPNVPSAVTITATMTDNVTPNTTKVLPGSTINYTVTINSTGTTAATGVSFNDVIDPNTTLVAGSVKASPIAVDDSYNTIGNVNISLPAAQGVIQNNDLNPNVTGTLEVNQVNATAVPSGGMATATTTHGSVTMHSDGSFDYTPTAGFSGGNDTFTYTLGNGTGQTDTATVTIAIAGKIWFVNSAAGVNGDGRLSTPFNILTGAGSADSVDAANDIIFLYTSGTNYTGGITLNSGEKIIGQGASQSILTITGFTAPSGTNLLPATNNVNDPVITTAGTVAITLGANNDLRGFTVGDTGAAGTDISGSSFGTLTIRDLSVKGTGRALNLATGTIATGSTFDLIETTGGDNNEGGRLNTVGGSFTATTTNIVNPTGTGVDVQSSPAGTTFSFGATTVNKGSTSGTGVNLNSNIGTFAFSSLAVTTSSGTGVSATSSGTVNVTTGSIASTGGPGLVVNPTAIGMTFTTVSSTNSGTTGISLTSASGSLSIGTTTITNPTGVGISATSCSATLSFGATTVNGSGGTGVLLGGSGVGNTGTITFGALNIAPDANQRGLLATDNTMTITTTSGTISNSGATAVEITRASSTTPLAMSLTSVSANGGTNGIVLTRTSGSFTIVGDGGSTNNSSGGTIQNSTSHGISLSNTTNISLDQMNIQSTGGSGINGTLVTNFTFTNGTINNSGNALGESNIAFNGNGALTGNNINGTLTVTGSTLTNAFDHGIHAENNDGTISNATITGNMITSTTSTATSKGSGIQLVGTGNSSTVGNLTKATISGNTIRNFPSGAGIQVIYGNTSATGPAGISGTPGDATNIITITNNTVRGFDATNRLNTDAIAISVNGGNSGARSQGNFDVSNNGTVAQPIGDSLGAVILIGNNGYATMTATMNNNVIVGHTGNASPGISGGNGIVVSSTETPDLTLTASGNNISQIDGNGILLVGRGVTGTAKLAIKNNTVAAPLTGVRPGIRVDAGNASSVDDAVCLDISGNTSAGSGGSQGIGLRKQGIVTTTNDFGVEGMAATSSPGVEAFVDSQNPAGGGTLLISATSGFSNCNTAPNLADIGEALSTSSVNPATADGPTNLASVEQDTLHVTRRERFDDDEIEKLDQTKLNWMVQAAIERWRQTGISAEEITKLEAVTFEIADLPADYLAQAASSGIKIDETAAGYGWYFDESPMEDSEFDVLVPGREIQTTDLSPAHGRVDLLTVVMRELGTVYLQGKRRIPKNLRQNLQALMESALSPATRRLPLDQWKVTRSISRTSPASGQSVDSKVASSSASQPKTDSAPSQPKSDSFTALLELKPAVFNPSADLMPSSYSRSARRISSAPVARSVAQGKNAPSSGETINKALGTIPPGEKVVLIFSVTVNNPPGAAQVSTQGTVSATGISNVLTDDPDTGTAGDPTVTLVDTTITWTGATSTNWDTGSNWNTTLAPVAINDVNIPAAGVANEPTISASSPTINSLTIATGRTLTITGQTLNIAGNWTNNGALAGNGTVVFNGNGNTQTLAGSTTFNNLTINHTGTGTVTASGSTLAVSNLLRIQAGTFISSSNLKDVQIDSGATLQSDGSTMNVSGNWTNNGGTFTPGAGTVIFNSTTAGQTIGGTAANQTFNIVQVNKSMQTLIVGGSTTTLNLNGALTLATGTFDAGTAATINAAGNWTNNGGTFTPGSGTVIFNNAAAAQTIGGTATTQTFGSLTVNKVLQTLSVVASTTTLNINGTFLLTSGTFDKGTAATINVGGNWTKNGGTFTQGTGTVVFGGSSAQTIGGPSATTFNNLTINNAAGVTISTAQTVSTTLTLTLGALTNGANLTLGNGSTVSRSGGSLGSAPTFGATVNVVYTAPTPAASITTGPEIPVSTSVLSNLTINNPSNVNLNANATCNGVLTLTAGDLITGAFTFTMPVAATSAGTTDVVGNVKRTGFVINGAALSFGNPFNTIKINTGTTSAPTDITVNLAKSPPPTFTGAVNRTYTITPNGGSGISATVRLHYLDPELNGNTEGATLNLFRFDGTNWHKEGQTANDTAANWVEKNTVAQFSPWTLNSTVPTEARLESFNATGYDGGTLIEWRTGFEVDNLGFNLYRDEGGKRVAVNSQLVAGSALVAGSGVAMRAGQSYAWWDAAASKSGAQYWLESIDLNGQSEWHGPFFSRAMGGDAPALGDSAILGRTENTQTGLTLPVDRAASFQAMKPEQIKVQSDLSGQPAVKMWVKREGFSRVTATELAEAGLDPKADTRLLQLYADGQQIPINVISDKDGLLSAIEFYGRGLDAAFTDQRVYWLVSGSQPGLRIKQVKGGGQRASVQSFLYTAERKDRTIYFSGLRNGERENFFGAVIAASPVEQSITLQNVDQSAKEAATIEVALQGVTTLPHRVWIYLNQAFVGEISFEGQTESISSLAVAQSLLRSGDNQVKFVTQEGPSDVSLVDYIRLSYWHSFMADDNSLRFTTAGNQEVTVTGFTSGAIRVLDVTDPDSVQELVAKVEQQKDGFAVTVSSPGARERQLLAIADELPGKPTKLAANQPSSWRTSGHAADLVMIARREYFSSVEPLSALRSKQGLKVELADIEDVFDEFSFGNKSPQAVKDFLLYATTSWKIKPRYVLLVGDASYDGKNYLGLGDWDQVPTRLIDTSLMETASDDWLADFNSDGIADLAVGRLAARTVAEASTMVRKIVGYESSQPLESMLLVADINSGFDFELSATELRALIPGNLRVEQINRGQMDDATAKSRLIDAITRGQKIVNYMGHGSANLWSGSLLTNETARSLTNGERLPLFVMMTCLNGYFHDPALDSLAESLLKAENGGAVAVWTSTGLTVPVEQALLNQKLYQLLFSSGNAQGQALTLGDATARAKASVSDTDIRRTWVLLGDPTMRLK